MDNNKEIETKIAPPSGLDLPITERYAFRDNDHQIRIMCFKVWEVENKTADFKMSESIRQIVFEKYNKVCG